MLRIDTTNFIGHTQALLMEYLRINDETEYEIMYMQTRDRDGEDLLRDNYLSMAYAGQMLAEIAADFGYLVPDHRTSRQFLFQVSVRNKKNLAQVLRKTINGHYCVGSQAADQLYIEEASLFEDRVFDRTAHCYTMGLLDIANRAITKESL